MPSIAAPKPRVALWDNARWLSITLVVIGHGVQRLTLGSDHALELYIVIYAFHIPAFAILSGYLSKAEPLGRQQMIRVLTDILIPYAIFQAIWSLVQFLVEGNTSGYDLSQPHWTLWFLVVLALWRIALPYLALLRWPLLWAVVLAVGVGYLSSVGATFALSRTIALLPFFVLGWQLRQWNLGDRWLALRAEVVWRWRAGAIAVFAVWVSVVVLYIREMRTFSLANWFMYDESYGSLHAGEWWAGPVRLACLLLGAILAVGFLMLVPRRQAWFTTFGQATMYVYLLHSFVLYPLRETGVLLGRNSDATGLVSIVLCCIAISIALASPLVRVVFRPLVEPRVLWLFARTARDSPAPAPLSDRRAAAPVDAGEQRPDRTPRRRRSR